jgi:pyridoxal phosphate enzyme (YggS family)
VKSEFAEQEKALVERISTVENRIAKACLNSGRSRSEVALLPVSKLQPIEKIRFFLSQGFQSFGENYVQEFLIKNQELKEFQDLKWHLIGPIQTNKLKFTVSKVDTIQSLDRIEAIEILAKKNSEVGVKQKVMIQVRLGNEKSKSGVDPKELLSFCEKVSQYESLIVTGLMSLPPIEISEIEARKYFSQLRLLKEELENKIGWSRSTFQHLSIGTSQDFEWAIQEGSTMVRIGSELFGARL